MTTLLNIFWYFAAKILAYQPLVAYLIERAKRTPYYNIMSPDNSKVYMERYWLFNPYPDKSMGKRPFWQFPISIRLHCIREPDLDRHLHDHPWNARTIILRGAYIEERKKLVRDLPINFCCFEDVYYKRSTGDTARIKFNDYHRITNIQPAEGDLGVWTMFITGRYRGVWGYDVDGVKVPFKEYLK